MVKINAKRGAFLTLGITFVSITVLTLAALILRNAEMSEERISEFAIMDRVYNLDKSVGISYKRMVEESAGFNFSVSDEGINFSKFHNRTFIDNGTYPAYYIDKVFQKFTLQRTAMTFYLRGIYPGLRFSSETGELRLEFRNARIEEKNDVLRYWFFGGNLNDITEEDLGQTGVSYFSVIGGDKNITQEYKVNLYFKFGKPYINWTRQNLGDINADPWDVWLNLTVYGEGDHFDNYRGYLNESGSFNENGVYVKISQIIVINNTMRFEGDNGNTNVPPEGIDKSRPEVLLGRTSLEGIMEGSFLAIGTLNGTFTEEVRLLFKQPTEKKVEIWSWETLNYTINEFEVRHSGPIKLK